MAQEEAMVPVVYQKEYDRYYFGSGHPFSPIRQHMVLDLLEAANVDLTIVQPDVARVDDLLGVHSAGYIEQVERASVGSSSVESGRYGIGTPDVPAFAEMDLAARILTGGTLRAARLIEEGATLKALQLGGGLHHAHRSMAAGFCIYNDLACAVRYFRDRGWRVAYLDIDVHHGDGVQELFYADRDVMTISLHESGRYLYPGSGFVHELGEGDGRGFSLNVPLEPGTMDDIYLDTFERVMPHALAWFQPDVPIVQCGADAHFKDPLADLALTTRGFDALFSRIIEIANDFSGGRALFTLGGGYDLDATVRVWALLILKLLDIEPPVEIPEAFLDDWSRKLMDVRLSRLLHDESAKGGTIDQKAVTSQNREVSRRLLEMAASHWY
ncbi:MAG: acetoin utilization protein AcuC [Bacteroidota bacterium]